MARQIKVTFKNESKVISETTVESGTQVFSIIKNLLFKLATKVNTNSKDIEEIKERLGM